MISTDERTQAGPVSASPPVERLDTREWVRERISGTWSGSVLLAWYGLFVVALSLEPAASHPDAIPAWIAVPMTAAQLSLIAAMAVGLALRRRWGLVAALAGGALFVAASVACPVSGHHTLGAWWFGQMACALGMVGMSAFALRRAPATN